MTTNITIKDSTGTDVVFTVVRQPAGNVSAILLAPPVVAGQGRAASPKIELSARSATARTTPTLSVTVPYGTTVNGMFVKQGQVSDLRTANQPIESPDKARLDAAAFAKNAASNPQVIALFDNGTI